MKKIYALYDKLDNSISSHFFGGEGVSDVATLRSVRAQFKDHYAVKDLSLILLAVVSDSGSIEPLKSYQVIGELYPNGDKIDNA